LSLFGCRSSRFRISEFALCLRLRLASSLGVCLCLFRFVLVLNPAASMLPRPWRLGRRLSPVGVLSVLNPRPSWAQKLAAKPWAQKLAAKLYWRMLAAPSAARAKMETIEHQASG